MEGNFPNSMYNRKSSIVVKKLVPWIFSEIVQYVLIIDSIRKKNQTVSTYDRNLRVILIYYKIINRFGS